MKVSSLNEIRLYRKNLKRELCYSEESIQNEISDIVAGYKSWITYTIIEKGVTLSVNLLLKMLFSKKSR